MSEVGPIKPGNAARININLAEDVRYWCRELGCSEARLQVTVRKVGSRAEAVKREITGRWRAD
jgi:hypothetical protein